jgi:hypothetical protein
LEGILIIRKDFLLEILFNVAFFIELNEYKFDISCLPLAENDPFEYFLSDGTCDSGSLPGNFKNSLGQNEERNEEESKTISNSKDQRRATIKANSRDNVIFAHK